MFPFLLLYGLVSGHKLIKSNNSANSFLIFLSLCLSVFVLMWLCVCVVMFCLFVPSTFVSLYYWWMCDCISAYLYSYLQMCLFYFQKSVFMFMFLFLFLCLSLHLRTFFTMIHFCFQFFFQVCLGKTLIDKDVLPNQLLIPTTTLKAIKRDEKIESTERKHKFLC